VVKNDGGKRFTPAFKSDVILRMRKELCGLQHSHTLFWGITQFVLIVEPYKLHSQYINRGQGFPICWKKFAPYT